MDSAARPARWKVARALSELVHETDEKGAATPVHLSQRELASLVGVGLNTAEEALRALAAMGLVNRRYRLIVVPDPARLRAFAEADSQNP
jgi:DNA-binding GntR family transcriptional regulator